MSETSTNTSSFQLGSLTKNLEFLYGVVLVTTLPSALGYLRRVMGSGHYEFAVLFIPVVVLLMKSRLDKLKSSAPGSRPVVLALMMATAVFMVLSTFVAPHFWILSFMSLTMCYVYDRYGMVGARAILPLWLILIVVIPLPRSLDNLLVTKMQLLASELASWILDALGLIHFRNGVVLITQTDQFMTEEACSGIRSLFSSLGAIGIYCVYKQYPIWRFAFNLLQTVFWVFVGNAIRITTVVWVADNWTKALAHGRPHEILGLCIFLLIIVLVISTDRILQVILDMSGRTAQNESSGEEMVIDVTAKSPQAGSSPKRSRAIVVAFAAFGLFLSVCGIRLMTADKENFVRNPLFEVPPFPISAEQDLPKKIGGWELQKFEPIDRSDDVILAAQSYTWTYKKGNVELVVSVDGPWEFWHDITICYRGIGWTTDVTHKFNLQAAGNQSNTGPLNHSRIELSRSTGERGLVFFAQHDLDGKEVGPSLLGGTISLESMKPIFLANIRYIFGIESNFDAGLRQYELPLATIQVFCANSSGLTEEQLSEIERF